ncbi:unnamed protein product, partial [Polarella glacialis]
MGKPRPIGPRFRCCLTLLSVLPLLLCLVREGPAFLLRRTVPVNSASSRLQGRAGPRSRPSGKIALRSFLSSGTSAVDVPDDWRKSKEPSNEDSWPLWASLPIAPYERRVTMRYEMVPGQLWGFEQKQGILYIHVPVRMTVYRMQTRRGLFIYAPIAPTKELISMIRELEALYGEVAYIVLPTVAVEHKYVVGPFSQFFPKAEVWVCPGQFSVPLQLPLQFLGFPLDHRLKWLPKDPKDSSVPAAWREEGLDFRVLGPVGKDLVNGAFAETVFYIRRLRTMLVTDLVVSISSEPPEIVAEEPRALIFHARDDAKAPLEATREAMLRGWRRMAAFALFFQWSAVVAEDVSMTQLRA